MRILIFLLSISCFHIATAQSVTAENIAKDLSVFKEKLIKTHPDPFYKTSEQILDAQIKAVQDNWSLFNAEQAYVKLLGIVASIGDGHTNLYPWDYYNQFPIRFYWLQDEIFVSATDEAHVNFLGGKLKAVNGKSINDVTKRLAMVIPGHESVAFTRNWSSYYLTISQIMYGLSITDEPGRIEYELELADGSKSTLILDRFAEANEVLLRPYEKEPMFYDTQENGLWFEELDNGLIYFHFSSYPKKSDFKKLGKELNNYLKKDTEKTLLIDLRRNGGGDFTKGRALLDHIEETVVNYEMRVYVAIAAGTYSAAVGNAGDFKQRLYATLIGEVTAGRPIGYQENNPYTLPNSGLPGSISSILYKFMEEDTDGIFPDIEVKYTWEHYVEGRDPVMEYLTKKK